MSTVLLVVLLLFAGLAFRERISALLRRLTATGKAERVLCEDTLKHLYKCEASNEPLSLSSLAGQLNVKVDRAAELVTTLQRRALVRVKEGRFRLTTAGREYALHVIRAHRLWESYFADRTGVSEVEWHGRAEKLEHEISREEADALWDQLGRPTHDPHGDPLPTSQGAVDSLEGVTLVHAKPGQRGHVIHVEDEPESVYVKLVDLGIFPGMELRVLAIDTDRVRILVEGSERELGTLEAGNVTLRFFSEEETDFASTSRLTDLKPGEKGTVALISKASRGVDRRRFMDLGILPGTVISAELVSPGGDPVAYRIRGALIALRREHAEHVLINRMGNSLT